MRVADYIADSIYKAGCEDIFIVTGGGLMFLTDGIACNEKIKAHPCHHEQAASMAAIAYSQYRNTIGCCYVTTGCGGTNTLTGVLHAWQDNVPIIFISGQCNRNEMMTSVDANVRYLGIQEGNIVDIVQPITKYATTIMDKSDVVYCVEKALFLAEHGRPGPVWIDVPMDIQEAIIEPEKLDRFKPEKEGFLKSICTELEIEHIAEKFKSSKMPMILAGHGLRLAGAEEELKELIELNNIPIVGTRQGWDVYPSAWPLHIGRVDIRGNRAANFALQNSDLLLVLGSSLSMRTTGYNCELFARNAKTIVVDVDKEEHSKGTVKIDKFIKSDLKEFLLRMLKHDVGDHREWADQCLHWKKLWPAFTSEHNEERNGISMFAFCTELSEVLPSDGIVVTDSGSTTTVPMQSMIFEARSQRYLGSSNQSEMGYVIPGTVGAAVASKHKSVIAGIVGDGSFQMNIQELQTIVHNNLPIKLFVWNNGGYASIRGNQKNTFEGRYLGVGPESGTSFPSLEKIAWAYGIRYCKISTIRELKDRLKGLMSDLDPVICEVMCWYDEVIPQIKGTIKGRDGYKVRLPIEDMMPFLPRDQFEQEMIIKPIKWW